MRRVRILNRSTAFGREQRVAEFIRKELGEIIRRKMRDPRVDVSNLLLNEVRVSRDLAIADVYVRICDIDDTQDQKEIIEVLQSAAGFLRSELSQRNSMRTTPKLRFFYDDLDDIASHIDDLIDTTIQIEAQAQNPS